MPPISATLHRLLRPKDRRHSYGRISLRRRALHEKTTRRERYLLPPRGARTQTPRAVSPETHNRVVRVRRRQVVVDTDEREPAARKRPVDSCTHVRDAADATVRQRGLNPTRDCEPERRRGNPRGDDGPHVVAAIETRRTARSQVARHEPRPAQRAHRPRDRRRDAPDVGVVLLSAGGG